MQASVDEYEYSMSIYWRGNDFFFLRFEMFCLQDYQHSLVFVTERERFEVPIYAIGPRAILDFRDEIHLPACPMKYSTERTHLVRNIGNCTAKFMLQTQRWEPVLYSVWIVKSIIFLISSCFYLGNSQLLYEA